MPLLTIMRPRSQAQLLWMGSEFDAVTEHVPDRYRHLRLAREMLDTQAHGLKPHTHPVHSPARPADPQIPLTSPLLCRVQGELWRNPPSQDVILLGVSFDFWQCGELELRIAEPHFAPSTTLRRFRGCFSTTKLRPYPTAQRAAAASSQCCVCRLSGGAAFAGCWGPAQAGPAAAQESSTRRRVAHYSSSIDLERTLARQRPVGSPPKPVCARGMGTPRRRRSGAGTRSRRNSGAKPLSGGHRATSHG